SDRGLPRVSPAAFRANLMEMIERARRFGTRHIILSTNHPTLRHKTLLSGESLEERRRHYNWIMREVAAETEVTLCDIDDGFAGLDGAALEPLLLPYPDHLHLSARGHAHYAGLIYPPVAEAIRAVIA
ncbi:MAG TPA: SGNH/GDSL hydrolase family protein, partial [Magnetospirillum sp.]|nr:SGNH/GDSL hydrolase family protein [Magnetospirillum sp.]